MAEPLLSVRNLRVEYLCSGDSVCAVDDVSFDIHRGEVFGLAGESGSGKSTIALALMRILQPPGAITGGEVYFEGRDVLAMRDDELRSFRWRKIAMVFQSAMNALNPVLSIGEQICDVIQTHETVSRQVAWSRAGRLLEMVGIDAKRLQSFPHQLSGGMRQRVVIAMAMALKPPLLIMDEPTTALDVVVQKEILQQIAELQREFGFSILFITHDLSLMFEFSQRMGILYAAELVECAPSHTLLRDAKHPYTQGLKGSFPALHGPRKPLTGIGGSPPNLRQLPSGCRFHPRCSRVMPRCSQEHPHLETIAEGRYVACHLHDLHDRRHELQGEDSAMSTAPFRGGSSA